MTKWLEHHYHFVLVIILLFAFTTRIIRLDYPKTYVFDEVYHAVTAKLINRNDPQAYEWTAPAPEPNTAIDWLHPPLAKYTQALGMKVFGENSFGWRISSVVFGVFVIWATYLLAQELFQKRLLSLAAAFLASLDGLLLVQSRIAMNDIHVTFFILLTLLLYVRYWKKKQLSLVAHAPNWPETLGKTIFASVLVGLSAGLALGTKWSGFFVLVTYGIVEILHLGYQVFQAFKSGSTSTFVRHVVVTLTTILPLAILPFVIYVLSYAHMFAQGKSFWCGDEAPIPNLCYLEKITNPQTGNIIFEGYISHFFMLHRQIFWYQTNLEATHPFQSRPAQWFLNLRPVWYYVSYPSAGMIENIYALGNPAIFWLGAAAVIGSLAYVLSTLTAKLVNPQQIHKLPPLLLPLTFVLLAYFLMWLPWQASPRIMFFYHYTPAVPLLCIIVSFWLYKLWQLPLASHSNKNLVLGCVAIIAVVFGVFYPQWTGLPVSQEFANRVYFSIPSWK